MYKKIIETVLMCTIVLGLSACGKTADKVENTENAEGRAIVIEKSEEPETEEQNSEEDPADIKMEINDVPNKNEIESGTTISDYFKTKDRIWLYVVGGMDKNNEVYGIYYTRPDGILRFAAKEKGFGTLGDFAKMNDEQIMEIMDSEIKSADEAYKEYINAWELYSAGQISEDSFYDITNKYQDEHNRRPFGDYASDEAAAFFRNYIMDNNLHYWFSVYTDSTGNMIESESLDFESYPKPANFNSNNTYTLDLTAFGYKKYNNEALAETTHPENGDVIEYEKPIRYFSFETIGKGTIYDSNYIVLVGEEKFEGVLISRYDESENINIEWDSFNTEGILIDEYKPDNYVPEIVYQENYIQR